MDGRPASNRYDCHHPLFILTGSREMAVRIALNPSTFGEEEISAAKAAIDFDEMTMGARCDEFEKQFAAYIGCRHAIMVNSGSSANLLAMFVLASPLLPGHGRLRAIVPGAEVIMPALTWPTTTWPVVQAGGKPTFVDCDPDTLQMPARSIEAAITSQTVGIVIVHALGSATNLDEIRKVAQRYGIWLFEDSCEALGVVWEGKKVGSFGVMGSFSFASAQISTIEGGMVVTNDDALADFLKAFRTQGWVRSSNIPDKAVAGESGIDPRYLFVSAGFDFRPSEINAAIGLAQLKRLDRLNEERRTVFRRFDDELGPLKDAGCFTPVRHDPRSIPAPLGYAVLCQSRDVRDGLGAHLEAAGIETRPILGGNIVRQPALAPVHYRMSGELRGADRVMDCGLYWGVHPNMAAEEINYVVEMVREYFGCR